MQQTLRALSSPYTRFWTPSIQVLRMQNRSGASTERRIWLRGTTTVEIISTRPALYMAAILKFVCGTFVFQTFSPLPNSPIICRYRGLDCLWDHTCTRSDDAMLRSRYRGIDLASHSSLRHQSKTPKDRASRKGLQSGYSLCELIVSISYCIPSRQPPAVPPNNSRVSHFSPVRTAEDESKTSTLLDVFVNYMLSFEIDAGKLQKMLSAQTLVR